MSHRSVSSDFTRVCEECVSLCGCHSELITDDHSHHFILSSCLSPPLTSTMVVLDFKAQLLSMAHISEIVRCLSSWAWLCSRLAVFWGLPRFLLITELSFSITQPILCGIFPYYSSVSEFRLFRCPDCWEQCDHKHGSASLRHGLHFLEYTSRCEVAR